MADEGPVVGRGHVDVTADGSQMTRSLSAELGKLGGPLGQIGNIGKQASGLIQGGFTGSKSAVAGLGLGLLAVGGLAAAFAIKSTGAFTDVGKEVIKLQRYTGGTAEEMSKLRYAAQQSGVGTDLLAKAMFGLSKNMVSGKGDFDKWGIATVDATGKTLPLDKVLYNVADKFKNGVIPQAEKAGVAAKLFGKAGADLVPMLNKGSEGLKALGAEAQKYGLVLTGSNIAAVKAATAAHREQTAAMQGLQVQIGSQVLPTMTSLTKSLTTGLLVVMPAISEIVSHGVVPAFSAMSSVVGGTAHVLADHAGLVKIAGLAIGTVMVPALGAWAISQGVVLAQDAAGFLLGVASTAVRAASSIGLLTGSLEAGNVALTAAGVSAAGAVAGIGIAFAYFSSQNQKFDSEGKKLAANIVAHSSSAEDAIVNLTAAQKGYHKEAQGGITILGQTFVLSEAQRKSEKTSIANYKELAAAIDAQNQAIKDRKTAESDAGDAISESLTKSGLAIATLGGQTKLTTGQIDELAASMNINLATASKDQIAQMATQASRLGITSTAVLKLADDHRILSDWTQDVAKRTQAFTDELDVLIGGATGAERADIAYQKSIEALTQSFKDNGRTLDITTGKGQANEEAILTQIDATTNMIKANLANGQTMDQQKPIIDSHVADLRRIMTQAGFTTGQIQALLTQYHLTPEALAQITPAIAGQVSAWDGLSGAIGGTNTAFQQLVAQFRKDVGVISSTGGTAAAAAVNINQASAGLVKGPGPLNHNQGQLKQYDVGGFVDGPKGKPQLAIVHGGERVLTTDEVDRAKVFTGGSKVFTGASPPAAAYQHGGDTINIVVNVAGSVVKQRELVTEIRQAIDTYYARQGGYPARGRR
jgi:hypothetical protein